MSTPGQEAKTTRLALLGIAAMVCVIVIGVAAAKLAGFDPREPIDSQMLVSCDLRFEDAGTGTVHIYTWPDDALVTTLAPGEGSFIRGVLRSFARDRRSRDLDGAQPFRLAQYADGTLSIEDTATGTLVNLQAFGPDNAGAFASLLQAGLAKS